MKKLMIIGDQSVITGTAKCGIADVIDSLSISLANLYDVIVVVPDGESSILHEYKSFIKQINNFVREMMFLNVKYYLIQKEVIEQEIKSIAQKERPDIIHNFGDIGWINYFSEYTNKTVLTIDNIKYVVGKLEMIKYYDEVCTVSKSYADEILKMPCFSNINCKITGVTNGLSSLFSSVDAPFLYYHYPDDDITWKEKQKYQYLKRFKLDCEKPVFSFFGKLSEDKGFDLILDKAEYIIQNGGILFIVGRGNSNLEQRMEEIANKSQDIIWIRESANSLSLIPAIASSDFYLSPSRQDACGLMPMAACKLGTIPIVSDAGGLKDNFNTKNSIMILEKNLSSGIDQAFLLYSNKTDLYYIRDTCMKQEFGWDKRNQGYINIYEGRK